MYMFMQRQLLHELYAIVMPKPTAAKDTQIPEPFEGTLERLPDNRICRNTILRTWRLCYVRLQSGVLYIYEVLSILTGDDCLFTQLIHVVKLSIICYNLDEIGTRSK